MATKTKGHPKFHDQLKRLLWCIVAERCSREAALRYLVVDNPVGVPIPPNTSYLAQIEIIASSASLPIPIESLSTELEQKGISSRGNTFSGNAANYIDRIASNCDGMRWWITKQGLVVDRVEAASNLSDFDVAAGRLMVEHFQNGRLKKGGLEAIVKALDEKQYPLLDALQPSYREKVAKFNRHNPSMAIRTFQKAVEHRRLGRRGVQKALYASRDRFLKSLIKA